MNRYTALFVALSLTAIAPAYADLEGAMKDRVEARHDAVKDMAEQRYDAAKNKCDALSGNTKDVCMKDAKAAYTREKSEATADEKAGKAHAESVSDQAEANYKAAKERCDQLSGSAKDACVSSAKMKYSQ